MHQRAEHQDHKRQAQTLPISSIRSPTRRAVNTSTKTTERQAQPAHMDVSVQQRGTAIHPSTKTTERRAQSLPIWKYPYTNAHGNTRRAGRTQSIRTPTRTAIHITSTRTTERESAIPAHVVKPQRQECAHHAQGGTQEGVRGCQAPHPVPTYEEFHSS